MEDEETMVQGYATAGGGRGIARVEVSTDGGETWQVADRSSLNQPTGNKAWHLQLIPRRRMGLDFLQAPSAAEGRRQPGLCEGC